MRNTLQVFKTRPAAYNGGMAPKTDALLTRLKEWSETRGIHRAELGRMLGVSRQAITDWYAKRRTPTSEQVLTIIEVMKRHH
jgi:DNA-binding XRE family transcriptional regulator